MKLAYWMYINILYLCIFGTFPKIFGSVWVHSLTLSYTPESMKYDSWASLLAHTSASFCLGREPRARVATKHVMKKIKKFKNYYF
jgi:hypothetical protein